MPEGMDIIPPAAEEEPAESPPANVDRRKLLFVILGAAGALFLFYLFFAFYLLAALPDPSGAGQGLKSFGNLFYGTVSVLAVLLLVLFVLRLLRSGMTPDQLPRVLLRPGIGATIILGIAAVVFLQINQEVPLSIDVLEPESLQGITAPVTVIFGTQSLRDILRQQGLAPRQYKWDFQDDGKVDAETQENEVTTVFDRRGTYTVRLKMLLSNGAVREVSLRLNIPNVMLSIDPVIPIKDEEVRFDVTNLVQDPAKVESVLWDFNGDGENDLTATELTASHVFFEIGTFPVQVVIRYIGGLQETFTRSVAILEEREQPFNVAITSAEELTGTVPFGLVFTATVEEGIQARSFEWRIVPEEEAVDERHGTQKTGEKISHVFEKPGTERVLLRVVDQRGRTAETSVTVTALEPLDLKNIVINGTPKPAGNTVEGEAPLEVNLSAATNTPFVTFSWEQENASSVRQTEGTFRALYEDPGTYPVVLIAKDELGRMQKIPLQVVVLPPRSSVVFSAVPPTGVAPLMVTFDASDSFVPDGRITGFAWIFGDSGERNADPELLGAKVTHRYENSGTFTVSVRALTEDGRSFDAKKTIVVRSPVLHACIRPSRTTGTAPMGVRFDASCSTGTVGEYLWSFGDGATSKQTVSIQDHVFEDAGTFTVLLQISDGKGNFDEETVEITAE